jgi:hypothetical protein
MKMPISPTENGKKKRVSYTSLQPKQWIYRFPKMPKNAVKYGVFTALSLILIFIYLFIMKLYPEIDMVLCSRCRNPLTNWDGKFFQWKIWTDYLTERPLSYNIYFARNYDDIIVKPPEKHGEKSREMLVSLRQEVKSLFKYTHSELAEVDKTSDQPLIVFGTHHKTGTYLAKKLFARMCAKLKLCCLFHVTRDSLFSVYNSLAYEKVDILGHNQWVWYPYELNYTNALNAFSSRSFHRKIFFIHFYRHPFQKILSSYYYHFDGDEKWTTKQLNYHNFCPKVEQLLMQRKVLVHDSKDERKSRHCVRKFLYNTQPGNAIEASHCRLNLDYYSQPVSRDQIFNLCETVRLCETCCRKEHEATFSTDSYSSLPFDYHRESASNSDSQLPRNLPPPLVSSYLRTAKQLANQPTLAKQHQYQLRPLAEYQFLCQNLGGLIHQNESLQSTLKNVSPNDGFVLESALNYYENLRMAKIFNYTVEMNRLNTRLPKENQHIYSLNINLDELTENYEENIDMLLKHISFLFHAKNFSPADIQEELLFYNLKYSLFYRWSMSNPWNNHITNNNIKSQDSPKNKTTAKTTSSKSRKDYMTLLKTHPVVSKMYKPILDLMSSAFEK